MGVHSAADSLLTGVVVDVPATIMARNETDGAHTWLADLQPTVWQTWSAVAVAAFTLVAFAAVAPFAGRPLAQLNAIFPTLDAIVFVSDLLTAVLLYAQFSLSRSRALLALATGYFFTALIVIPHALTFAGAFSPTGLLGAGIQTGSWLFIFWHIGFGAALLAYALFRNETRANPISEASTLRAIGWSVTSAFGLVCGLTWLATGGVALLPPIILDQARMSPNVIYPVSFTILISAGALVVLSARPQRSVLDQWLMVVALAYIAELVLSGLFPSIRFSAGFYAGRAFSLVTSSIVLIVLIAETMRLYVRLARSHAMLQRERANKLMNFDAIVAAITHEVKQPLAVIQLRGSSAHQILEQAKPNFEEVQTILDEVVEAGHRVNNTLNSIRSLFGGTELRRLPVDLNKVALDALRSSREELEYHGVAARTKLASETPPFYGDRNQLYEVFYNLIHNAIEAMGSTIDDNKALEVRTELRESNEIIIEVEDTGPGIEPEKITEIFDAFVTTKPTGMGLGLAICRMIVERHGGQLSVSAANPHGTISQIIFPQSNPPH